MRFNDGLTSLSLGLGNKKKDLKYSENQLTSNVEQLNTLWSSNWLAQKIISKRANDMVRKWRDIKCDDLNADELEKIENLERELKIKDTLEMATVWSSLYGGVGLLVLTDEDVASELTNEQELKRLVIITPEMVKTEGEINNNILSKNFGRHDFYSLGRGEDVKDRVIVHHSRFIIVNAIERPPFSKGLFGISDLQPIYEALTNFDLLSTNIGDMVAESKIDIYSIEDLTEVLATEDGERKVHKLLSVMQELKSNLNALVLDKNNEYAQKELTFTGLKDLLVEFRNAVSGASNIPVTILFGQSVSGLASGDEDIQNYHEDIHALQESRLRPILEVIDPLLCNMAVGRYPENFWFEFNSLTEISKQQDIANLNTFSQAVNVLLQNAVVTEEQVANELKERALFNNISDEDLELLKNMGELDADRFANDGQATEEPIIPEKVTQD